jgi:nicotinate-nucleotide--dimethylbenzimidazole phosphoribosyltransferase
MRHSLAMPALPSTIAALVDAVEPVDAAAAALAAERHAVLAKPPGSLGRLEALGARLSAVSGRCPPPIPRSPTVVVAAADHGVHARGVTPWPQRITTRMVAAMCDGRAAVNAMATTVGADLVVVDLGCVDPPAAHPRLRTWRVRAGTADLSVGPAMGRDEAAQAVAAGATIATDVIDAGADLLITGDMGIANTTASACLIAACTGLPAGAVTGRGAGPHDQPPTHKVDVVARALALHRPDPDDPLGVLAAVGGLEHAALVGVVLAAAARRVPVLLDGVITNAAALVATRLCPPLGEHLIASHRSPEPGARVALDALGLSPLLDLGLRLGEGTGGLLAVPLVRTAARVLTEVALVTEL